MNWMRKFNWIWLEFKREIIVDSSIMFRSLLQFNDFFIIHVGNDTLLL